MRQYKLSLIALALAGTLATSACTPATETANSSSAVTASAQTESQRLAEFFATSFQAGLDESPMSQTYLGIKKDYGLWDDYSEQAVEQKITRLRHEYQIAQSFDESKLSEQEKLSLRIFKVNAERTFANDEFRHHTYVIHQFWGPHTGVPSFLINMHQISSVDDAEAYISRLQRVDDYFAGVIEQMKLREKAGVFPPRWAYDQMIQASHNVVSGYPFEQTGENSILADFSKKVTALTLDQATQDRLIKQAENALLSDVKPAYHQLVSELKYQRDITPEGDGVWRLPEGKAWYQNRLNWFTTTDLTAAEVHQIGLDNVERIHGLMRDIMQQVKFTGSLQDFFEFMRTDKQFYYADTDEGRQRYMDEATALINTMKETIPEYFGLIPKADMIVKRVEAFREKSAGKAFYNSPALDGSRPGIYYANLYKMEDMPTYQMEALAYHEGIPGHHMQRAIAQELEGIPTFQKFVSFTAYTEGWGLYTEELAKDMGFYQDPYSDFGRLAMELWRACRLVVDTGLHHKGWSREEAIEYLQTNTPNPDNDSVKAIERYIAMPGQATAYMIGKLKIMELRAHAQQVLGDKFDIRGFHDEILKDGPVPLSILEEKIKAWISSQQA